MNAWKSMEVMEIIVTFSFLEIVERNILLYDYVSDILKHKKTV